MSEPTPEVRAAGGVVVDEANRILLVHRPKYDDWSLPKGKLEDGETEEAAALREVEEETGVRCSLGRMLGTVSYRDRNDRSKTVVYWEMHPEDDSGDGSDRAPDEEVDELRWLEAAAALKLMTYDRDRAILAGWIRKRAGLP